MQYFVLKGIFSGEGPQSFLHILKENHKPYNIISYFKCISFWKVSYFFKYRPLVTLKSKISIQRTLCMREQKEWVRFLLNFNNRDILKSTVRAVVRGANSSIPQGAGHSLCAGILSVTISVSFFFLNRDLSFSSVHFRTTSVNVAECEKLFWSLKNYSKCFPSNKSCLPPWDTHWGDSLDQGGAYVLTEKIKKWIGQMWSRCLCTVVFVLCFAPKGDLPPDSYCQCFQNYIKNNRC